MRQAPEPDGIDAFVLKYRTTYVDPNAPPAAAAAGRGHPPPVRKPAKTCGVRARTASKPCACSANAPSRIGVLSNRIGIIGLLRRRRRGSSRRSTAPPMTPRFRRAIYAAAPTPIRPRKAHPAAVIAVASTTSQSNAARLTCSAPGSKPRRPPSCTSSRPAGTASCKKAAAPITTWTAWRSGSSSTAG